MFKTRHELGYFHGHGFLDSLFIEKSGVIQIEGWDEREGSSGFLFLKCFLDKKEIPLCQIFRVSRPDLPVNQHHRGLFKGIVLLYRLPEKIGPGSVTLRLKLGEKLIFEADHSFFSIEPHYPDLFDAAKVKHRKDIYASGPPAKEVNNEVLALAKTLPGPILDFGCGCGLLVHLLRELGLEVYGLELNSQVIVDNLMPEVQSYISLYDGKFPLPFPGASFESVIASEVLEHISEYERALDEIARIATKRAIVTVPDMSAIPINYSNGVVPWHLLEKSHVNFFTPNSFYHLLKKFFPFVDIAKINPIITNGTKWYYNLVGICGLD